MPSALLWKLRLRLRMGCRDVGHRRLAADTGDNTGIDFVTIVPMDGGDPAAACISARAITKVRLHGDSVSSPITLSWPFAGRRRRIRELNWNMISPNKPVSLSLGEGEPIVTGKSEPPDLRNRRADFVFVPSAALR